MTVDNPSPTSVTNWQHTHSAGHSHPQNAHNHVVSIGSHSHTLDTGHSHTLNTSHSHSTDTTHSHSVTTTLTPGIVETTTPSTMELKVDWAVASATASSLSEFDLTPYLSKDADGDIVRGWHSLTFTPPVIGRIQANVVTQVFLQARGVVAG